MEEAGQGPVTPVLDPAEHCPLSLQHYGDKNHSQANIYIARHISRLFNLCNYVHGHIWPLLLCDC